MPKISLSSRPNIPWRTVAAIIMCAVLIAAVARVFNWPSTRTPEYALAGSSLVNAEELVTEAEAHYADFISSRESVEFLSDDGDTPLCFLVASGAELTDKVACGLAMHPSQDLGGYDTAQVSFTRVSDTDITGAVDGEFEVGGAVPAGYVLTRPDGKQAMGVGELVRPADASLPLPGGLTPPEGEVVIQERVEVITEVVREPVYVQVPGKAVQVSSASARDVKTSDGSQYRTERGTEAVAVQADIRADEAVPTEAEPTYTIIITTPEGEDRITVTPSELEEGFEMLVPEDAKVELGVELDGVEQRLDLRDGTITSDDEAVTDLLYAKPRLAAMNADRFRVSAEDASISGDVQQVAIKPYISDAEGKGTWAEEGAFVEVVVGDLDHLCRRLGNQPSVAMEPYSFDNLQLKLDGRSLGAPDVVAQDHRDANSYRIAWDAPADAATVEFSPNFTVQCEGEPIMSDEFISYSASATEEAAGWFLGEFVESDEEAASQD